MKLKDTLLAPALLSATAFFVSAATKLTPERMVTAKPFDRVVVTGRFNATDGAVRAVPRYADKEDTASFYVVDTSGFGNSGNQRVIAGLYKADAEKAKETSNRVINDVIELPKDWAVLIEPFDAVTVQGFYRNQPEINNAVTKIAKTKGAYSFYIARQIDANQGDNQRIIALIYRKNTKKCVVQNPGVIPVDSEVGCTALAAGSEAAKKVEIPDVVTTTSPSSEVGRFFETQLSRGRCYTAMLPDGTKVEELDKATAAMMVPFDSVKFSGNYGNMTEVSHQVAKRAAKKGTKYYRITRRWQEYDNDLTTSTDLYK